MNEVPQNAAFTLVVPLDRERTKTATFHIKDITESVYLAAKAMIDAGKQFDAVRMIIKALHVGGDDPALLNDNFVAVSSASKMIVELIVPLDGELKKN